jgi:hypothetical protein
MSCYPSWLLAGAASALLVACTGPTDDGEPREPAGSSPSSPASGSDPAQEAVLVVPERPDAVEYTEISGIGAMKRPLGLCELLRWYPRGIGIYRVERLVGYTEQEADGSRGGATYASLLQTERWVPGSAVTAARLDGGPLGAGVTASWEVSLRRDEEVLLLFDAPSAANRGYYGLDSLTVFRRKADGTFTNGQLFTHSSISDGDLKVLIQDIVSATGGCPRDVLPDYNEAPSEGMGPADGMEGPEVEGHRGGEDP